VAQIQNFAESLSMVVGASPEESLHPHSPQERANEFRAVEAGAAELEVLNFLNALVYLFKPKLVLETGTGSGLTALAILSALSLNGSGHLHTLEKDPASSKRAQETAARLDPGAQLRSTFHCADSLEWIGGTMLAGFDFVFFRYINRL
jgi:predicted O-methyltransferase YrrM